MPGARSFGVGGTARLATAAPDDVLDALLGVPGVDAGGITVRASEHLPGDVAARGSNAFDGDPTTAWSTAFGDPTGAWVEVQTPQPVTFDHLDLRLVADGRHSVPTQLRIDAGGESRTVDVGPLTDGATPGTTVEVPVTFDPLTGNDVRVTITGTRPVTTIEYYDNQPIVMPAAIAEVGIPGVQRDPVPATLPSACRDDLLTIGGEPFPVRLVGDAATAQSGGAIDVEPCAGPVTLDAGDHVVRSSPGRVTGLDVDGLVLGSDADGSPMALGPGGSLARALQPPERLVSETPTVRVVHDGRTKKEIEVHGARPGTPFWLVLGQSNNAGWKATVDGSGASIRPADGDGDGASTLVDGYANGWLVTPSSGSFRMTLEWEPQQTVWVALAISAATLLLCLVLACWRWRRRGGDGPDGAGDPEPQPVLAGPLVAAGSNTTRRVTIVTTIGAGFAAAFVARWWVGVVVAVCVLAVLLRPRLRFLLTLGAPACIAVTAVYVIVQQYRYRYPYGYFWVEHFSAVANVVWLGVLLLAADAVVELVRTRRVKTERVAQRFVVTCTSRLRTARRSWNARPSGVRWPSNLRLGVEQLDVAGRPVEPVRERLDLLLVERVPGLRTGAEADADVVDPLGERYRAGRGLCAARGCHGPLRVERCVAGCIGRDRCSSDPLADPDVELGRVDLGRRVHLHPERHARAVHHR